MTSIGAFSPTTAKRVLAATREVEKQQDLGDSMIAQRSDVIYFRNDTGEAIPPFGLLQIDGFEIVDDKPLFKVIRPYTPAYEAVTFLVNGREEVPVDHTAAAQRGPVYRVKLDASLESGDRVGWKADSFEAGLGCLMALVGIDDQGIGRCVVCAHSLTGTAVAEIVPGLTGTVTCSSQSGDHVVETIASTIPSGSTVVMWPGDRGRWIALKVC